MHGTIVNVVVKRGIETCGLCT